MEESSHAPLRDDARFQVLLAVLFLLLALAGFARSYLLRIVVGTFDGAPIYHVHGILMFSWFTLFLLQARFAYSGNKRGHRAAGIAGVALFTALACSTLALTIHSAQRNLARSGGSLSAMEFPAGTFITLVLSSVLFAWAVSQVRQPQVHRRVMVLVMVVMLQAAVSRLVVLPFTSGPPTVAVMYPTALATAPLLALVLWRDWRLHGRPHAVYRWGVPGLLGIELLIPAVAATRPAAEFALALVQIMG